MGRRQVPDASAQSQAGDAGVTEGSAGRRQSVPLCGCVEVLPERPAAAGRRRQLRIDRDFAHQAQVDDETPVADAMTCDAVTSTADRHRKIGVACEPDRGHDIRDIQRSHDQLRVPFDHPVERGTRDVEAAVGRSDDRPSVLRSQLGRRRHTPTLRDRDQLPVDLGKRSTPGQPEREVQVGDEVLDHLAHA